MSEPSKDIVELYIDSLTEHAGERRLADLRNENSSGNQRTGGRAKGDPLTAFDKEDFRQHVRQSLNDPDTKYFINEADGRAVFFNGGETNNTRFTFTPAQFTEGDGHAGTLMRDSYNRGLRLFKEDFDEVVDKTGVTPEIRSVSDGGWIEHLEGYRTQLENVPNRALGKGDLRTDYARAGDDLKTQPLKPLDYSAPNSPKMDSPLKRAYNVVSEAAGPVVKKTSMVILGAIPIIGMLPNSAEAAELKDKLATAIDNGDIPPEAVTEYNVIMAGHIAQGADPTVVLGEAGVQQSFNDWAERYNVQDDLRDSLQPSSLALMIKDGGTYIADNIDRLPSATADVVKFTGGAAVTAGEISMNAIDYAYDHISGNAEITQGLYDQLPSVNLQDVLSGSLTGDHASLNEREDVLDLLQSKARVEYFESQMASEEDPYRHAYFADRSQAAKDDFESSVEAMDKEQLNDVQNYLATYNQYIAGNMAENPNMVNETPTNPELLDVETSATSSRMAI